MIPEHSHTEEYPHYDSRAPFLIQLTRCGGEVVYVNPAYVTLIESIEYKLYAPEFKGGIRSPIGVEHRTTLHLFAAVSHVLQTMKTLEIKGSVAEVAHQLNITA